MANAKAWGDSMGQYGIVWDSMGRWDTGSGDEVGPHTEEKHVFTFHVSFLVLEDEQNWLSHWEPDDWILNVWSQQLLSRHL